MARRTSQDEVVEAWRAIDPSVLARLPEGGDPVKSTLLNPALLRLVAEHAAPGASVLDVGCGTGDLSVLLARSGFRVTALDVSPALVAHTGAAAARHDLDVVVREGDLLDPDPDPDPDEEGFDAVVAALVVCGIPDLDAAIEGCLRRLRPGGLLVVAVEHPCFEQNLREWTRTGVAEVTRYLSGYELPGSIAPDFHRPLSAYVTTLLGHGCRLVALEEPGADPDAVARWPFLKPLHELPLFLMLAAVTDDGLPGPQPE